MPILGITRCDDATSSDLLGVPVWFSHRPGGLTSQVHAGKGVQPLEARTGAVMEAVEYAVAERADSTDPLGRMPIGEALQTLGGSVTVADLAPRFGAPAPSERVVAVDGCEDVATGTLHRMPSELLRLLAPDTEAAAPLFGTSSNGLASGTSLEDATLHALLEVLERDTLAHDHVRPSVSWLSPDSLPSPFADWHARWLGQGVHLRIRNLVNEIGLCCLEAEIRAPGHSGPVRSTGYGIHPDAQIALARAITEAAQGRLYALCFRAERTMAPDPSTPQRLDATGVLAFDDLPTQPGLQVEEALALLLARLKSKGMPWVLRRRLHESPAVPGLDGLHVVKLVVPGCETAVGRNVRIGRRLAQRLVSAG